MKNKSISRRHFCNLSGTGLLAGAGIFSGAGILLSESGCVKSDKITAREVIDRIKSNVGVP